MNKVNYNRFKKYGKKNKFLFFYCSALTAAKILLKKTFLYENSSIRNLQIKGSERGTESISPYQMLTPTQKPTLTRESTLTRGSWSTLTGRPSL
jgi:hypothetical protein